MLLGYWTPPRTDGGEARGGRSWPAMESSRTKKRRESNGVLVTFVELLDQALPEIRATSRLVSYMDHKSPLYLNKSEGFVVVVVVTCN